MFRIAGVFLFMMGLSATMLGSGCSGNACGVIARVDAGGCIIFKNNGKRAVHIALGAISKNTNPGDTFKVVNFDGSCLKAVVGDLSANYI
jgi:hypothetical protein